MQVLVPQAMWDAKGQLQAIRTAGLRGRLPVGGGVVDPRVAYWMLHPDSRRVRRPACRPSPRHRQPP